MRSLGSTYLNSSQKLLFTTTSTESIPSTRVATRSVAIANSSPVTSIRQLYVRCCSTGSACHVATDIMAALTRTSQA